jgi:8-oxo-dGTP diphosphatase
VLYGNPASAAAGCVFDDRGRILLVQRSIQPFAGHWALPAGYQELDEDPHVAVVREILEETGIESQVLGLLDYYFIADDPRKPANVAVYLCRKSGGGLVVGDDVADVAWFSLDALPEPIGFDNSQRILERLRDPRRYPDSPWNLLQPLLRGQRESPPRP